MRSGTCDWAVRPLLTVAIAAASLGSVTAIVIRHDKLDAEAVRLGQAYISVGQVLPDGGCTLIAPTWALTAAHVAASLTTGGRVAFDGIAYSAKRVVVHPEGQAPPGRPPEVDLALIEFVDPVRGVPPVALYRGRSEFGETLVIVGYGDFGAPGGPLTRTDGRRRAATNAVADAGPRRLFLKFDAPPDGTRLEGVGGPGDSGGPALIDVNGKWQVAGVSSASMDGKPGQYGVTDVYTRVGSYVGWIDGVVAGRQPPP